MLLVCSQKNVRRKVHRNRSFAACENVRLLLEFTVCIKICSFVLVNLSRTVQYDLLESSHNDIENTFWAYLCSSDVSQHTDTAWTCNPYDTCLESRIQTKVVLKMTFV